MTLLDCPRCREPLFVVVARDWTEEEGEVMDAYCRDCGYEEVSSPELGDAVVEP